MPVGTAVVQPDGSYSVATSVLANGPHPLSITAKDTAGTESQPTSIGTWTIIGFPTMSITPAIVNEASQYAIVRLTLSQAASAAITFTPSLSSGTGVVGTDTGSVIEYYTGSAWVSAAAGVTVPVGATGVLLRVAIVNDVLNETSKVVNIATGPMVNVRNPSGVATTITIRDDATGDLFSGANTTGTPDAPGANGLPDRLDDDRPLAVNSFVVNERSPFGVFTVTGVEGQLVELALRSTPVVAALTARVASLVAPSGTATIGTDTGTSLEYFNGSAWVPYVPGSFVAIPSDGDGTPGETATLRVRVAIVNDNPYEGAEEFILVVSNAGGFGPSGTGTIVDNGTGSIFVPGNTSGTPDSPATPGYPASLDGDMPLVVTATEADCGPGAQVTVIDPFTGAIRSQFGVFEPRFRGGARVVVGDVDADGADEIVIGSGPGRIGEIRVFEIDGTELVGYRTRPFGPTYMGGVEPEVGDIDGDGDEDLVAVGLVAARNTRVFLVTPNAADPVANQPFKAFAAFAGDVLGGGSVAVADLNNDGRAEIIRGSGPGAAALVNVFDVSAAPRIVDSFRPFRSLPRFRGGVAVSTTRFNGDQTPDILVAGGRGAGSTMEVYDGTINARVANARLDLTRLAAFADLSSREAAAYAVAIDTDGNGVADRIFATQAEGGSQRGVRVINRDGSVAQTFSAFSRNLRIATSRPRR